MPSFFFAPAAGAATSAATATTTTAPKGNDRALLIALLLGPCDSPLRMMRRNAIAQVLQQQTSPPEAGSLAFVGRAGLLLLLGALALDAALADPYPVGLPLLRLRDPHLEHAVVELGLDLVRVDPVGEGRDREKRPKARSTR